MIAAVQIPGPVAGLLLLILLVLLPLLAIQSARVFQAAAGDAEPQPALPPLETILTRTLLTQAAILLLAWYAGRGFGYRLFAPGPLGAREAGAALLALGAAFALRALLRRSRDAAERRLLAVVRLAPRTRREWILWGLTVAIASVAEEAAYRGVGWACLTGVLGDARVAAILLAAAFAAAHAVQGWKSGVVIFALALVLHALVAVTGTLLLAMAVHVVFDVVSGRGIAREAERLRDSSPA